MVTTCRLLVGHKRIRHCNAGLALAMLLLAGCRREEERSALSRQDKVAITKSPVINRTEGKGVQHAPPLASQRAPSIAAKAASSPKAAPPSSETRYRALGTEPFWAVTVKGSVVTLERPDHAPVHLPIARTDDGRAIRYLGSGFAMMVTEGPCSDGMSDAVWADRVSVTFGEGTLKGCGGVREDF